MNNEQLNEFIAHTVSQTVAQTITSVTNALPIGHQANADRARAEHPGTFDGIRDKLDNWIQHMETYLSICNTPRLRWASHGYAALTGAAYGFMARQLHTQDQEIGAMSWEDFVTTLRTHLRDPLTQLQLIERLGQLRMRYSLDGYIREFHELIEKLDEGSDIYLVAMFINGLPADYARFIRQQMPNTIYDAIHAARTFAGTLGTSHAPCPPPQHRPAPRSLPAPTIASNPNAMQIDTIRSASLRPLSHEERERLRSAHACFRCRKE